MIAAIYARFSSDKQNDSSITAQLRACQAYCLTHGYRVYQEYIDEAISGRSDERPAFQRMIADARAKSFDVLVCHKIDRFSRDRYDHSHYKRILQKNNIKLEYVDQRIDDTPEGALTESLLIGLSEYYSRNLAREVMKGMNERAHKGLFNGGTPPLGYSVDADKKYIINEHEAAAVRLIFEMYTSGYGLSKISAELNKQGYQPKRGGVFGKNSLHDILRNEKYIGVYKFGRVRATPDGRRNSHKSDESAITGTIPAIIDQQTWEKVKLKMAVNKEKAGRFSARREYLLSGLLYCKCGAAMTAHWKADRNKAWYVCGANSRKAGTCDCKSVEVDLVENTAMSILTETFADPANREELCKEINAAVYAEASELSGRINSLETELQSVKTKKSRLMDALMEGLLDDDDKLTIKTLNARKETIEHELSVAARSIKSRLITPAMVESYTADLATALKEKDPDKLRAVLPVIVERIDYDGENIAARVRVNSFVVRVAGLEPARP